MATQIATVDENPLTKFDAPTLKAMGNTQLDAGAPRSMFMPSNMGEAMELAKLMAASNFVPEHLRRKAGDCLAVVMQAGRWAMDPFAVGNKTYFVNNRMAYESQLVNAVINSSGVLEGRLQPEWTGEGNDLVCTVSGKIKGDPQIKTRRVPIKNITTRNSPLWKQDPEQQLAYYASRAWARLYAPEVLLGVYTPDEIDQSFGMGGVSAGGNAGGPLSVDMLAPPVDQEQDEQAGAVDYVSASSPNRLNGIVDDEGPADAQHGESHNGTDADEMAQRAREASNAMAAEQ